MNNSEDVMKQKEKSSSPSQQSVGKDVETEADRLKAIDEFMKTETHDSSESESDSDSDNYDPWAGYRPLPIVPGKSSIFSSNLPVNKELDVQNNK